MPDVEHGEREVFRHVGQLGDHAVGNHVHRAVVAAQRDRPQADRLDESGLAVDRDHVAEANLVFEDQEEAGDDVADEILRAEADGQAGDPRPGQDRPNVDAEE